MRKRHRIPSNKSRKVFRRNANRIHKKNLSPRPMRGGIRL